MPIKIPNDLPAATTLADLNIFVMSEKRAYHQDIRSIRILLVSPGPDELASELQLMRLLGRSPLQLELDIIRLSSQREEEDPHPLSEFYRSFYDICENRYDGMILPGTSVEAFPFTEASDWPELCEIMEWSSHNVYSSLHIGRGAQAGLYRHYGIVSQRLPHRLSGVFSHYSPAPQHPLMRGLDDVFLAPHHRMTSVCADAIQDTKGLQLLSVSDEAGVHIVSGNQDRRIFVTGHFDFTRPGANGGVNWRAYANLLFTNWINFVIYPDTPYDLSTMDHMCHKLGQEHRMQVRSSY